MDYSALGTGHEYGGHSKSSAAVGAWESTPAGVGGSHAQNDKQHRRDSKPRWSAFDVAADFVCLALPLALIGFLGAVLRLEGQEAEDHILRRWQNAISILATLFPMFFASVVGRMVFEVARWKLEKGSSLGSLEQLLGSRTFGGTIITLLHFPAFNLLGLLLVAIWAFSPLGAQSYLRILESPFEPVISHTECLYQDLRQRTGLAVEGNRMVSAGSAKVVNSRFRYLGTMFGTLLQLSTEIQADTMDLWGNVKVPFLAETSAENSADWQDITWSSNLERFSALAGIPLTSVPVSNSTLELESSYVELSCSNITKYLASPVSVEMEWDWPNFWLSPGGPPERGNGSWQGIGSNRSTQGFASQLGRVTWGIALDRFVDYSWSNESEQFHRHNISYWDEEDQAAKEELKRKLNSPALLADETGIESGPTKLFFEAYIDNYSLQAGYKLGAYCDVKQRYVENRIECRRTEETSRQNCTVVAQRPSQQDHPSEDITVLSFPEAFLHLATRLPVASYQEIGNSDLVVQWLDAMFVTGSQNNMREVQFEDVDDASFSRRFSQVLNTYLLLSTFDFGVSPDAGSTIEPNATAQVEVSQLVLTYRVSPLWVTLAFVCCGVLLAGGVLSIVFAHLAHGPEVLGFASSVVRDSKLMDMPPGVGRMSGIEISREMRDLRLRYGHSELTLQGQPLMGVGREHEMGRI